MVQQRPGKRTTQMIERVESGPAVRFIEDIGGLLANRMAVAGRALLLFVDACTHLTAAGRSTKTVVRQLEIAGFGSLMVLSLIAGLTGMIMAVQTGTALQKYGVEGQLGAIISATFCREMGPIWAAVIILARIGAAMSAEIGTMVVNEEVDALRMMSINPVRFLVMPRILALTIAMPILTAVADWVGMLGGALIASASFNGTFGQYMESAQQSLDSFDFFSGLFKSVIFAWIIGTISCDRGLNTSDGAEGVGRATTDSVVLNVIFVLIADMIMTSFIQLVMH
jgi:phospholipid/cholesterol/gamma-HCH transport system permease protein